MTYENQNDRNEQQQISQSRLYSQLARDDSTKATTLKWLAIEHVNVIQRISGKTDQKECSANRSYAYSAWNEKKDRRDHFNDDHRNRGRPHPFLVIET